MKSAPGLVALLLLLWPRLAGAEEDGDTIVLSTRRLENVSSKSLLSPLRKFDRDLYIIASVDVDGEKSGLELTNDKFRNLGLSNFSSFKEDCDSLHELLNETFERIGFDFIENNGALGQVESGLWLYLPVLKYDSLDHFKRLSDKYRDSKNVTFLVTDCDLLSSKQKARGGKDQEGKDEIRLTPVILQQITVMVFFLIILILGVYFSLNIKTPSSLLAPQQIKTKVS